MKFAPLLTLISALCSTALMFVTLLGGYNNSTLTNLDMFRINVSQIANTQFNNGTGNGCNCVAIANGTLTINGTAVINGTLTVGTATLGIAEIYSVYAINYCEGTFLPSFQDPGASAVITNCQTPSLTRHFDLVTNIENAMEKVGQALGENLSISNLDWPNGITDAFLYVKSAGSAFVGFLLVGLACLLLATMSAFVSVFRSSRTTAKFLFITSVIALLTLTICAGIGTAITTIVVNGINANGDQIGISADQGSWFVALNWIAVALLFISTLTTTATLFIGSSSGPSMSTRRLRRYDNMPYGYDMAPMPRRKPIPYDMDYWDGYGSRYSSRRTLVPDRDDYYYGYGDEFR